MKLLHALADLAVMLLIGYATIKAIEALMPGPWIVPQYGTWISQ